jgi:hypothetical protein
MSAGLYAHQSPPAFGPTAAPRRRGDGLKSEWRKQIEVMLPGQRALRFSPDIRFKSVQAAALRVGEALGRHYILRQHPISLHTLVWRMR